MKTVLLILLIAITTPAFAGGQCEVKTAGEMMGLVDIRNPHFQLDTAGVQTRVRCKASINLSLPMKEYIESLQGCKEQAFKMSYYDQDPSSEVWSRPVVRNCK